MEVCGAGGVMCTEPGVLWLVTEVSKKANRHSNFLPVIISTSYLTDLWNRGCSTRGCGGLNVPPHPIKNSNHLLSVHCWLYSNIRTFCALTAGLSPVWQVKQGHLGAITFSTAKTDVDRKMNQHDTVCVGTWQVCGGNGLKSTYQKMHIWISLFKNN